MLTEIVRQGVDHARDQHELLARTGPYSLDDATVTQMLRVWDETFEWTGVHAEQGARWHRDASDAATEVAVAEYNALVQQERRIVVEILEIARKLEGATIETLMAKSDLEVGVDALNDPWLESARHRHAVLTVTLIRGWVERSAYRRVVPAPARQSYRQRVLLLPRCGSSPDEAGPSVQAGWGGSPRR